MDETTALILFAPIATLIAAFFGPWLAYKMTISSKKRDEQEARVIAGNTAIYLLSLQFTALEIIKRQFMDPVRDHPFRHFVMFPSLPVNHDRLHIDHKDLTFLLRTEHRDVLYRLKIAEDCFFDALKAFNEWSRIKREEVEPLYEKAGFEPSGQYTPEEIERALGPRVATDFRLGAANAIELFDHAIPKLKSISTELHTALKAVFPGEKFITFEERTA